MAFPAPAPRDQLHKILDASGLPMLELAYFSDPRELELRHHVPQAILSSIAQMKRVGWQTGGAARGGPAAAPRAARVRFSGLSGADAEFLLRFLAEGGGSAYTPSERDLIRALPLFETVQGTRVAASGAEFFTVSAEVPADVLPLPAAAGSGAGSVAAQGILRRLDWASALYADLGFAELSEPALITRFLLPEFGALPAPRQRALMLHIRAGWPRLSADASLLAAIKDLAFLPAHPRAAAPAAAAAPPLLRAADLFDPRHELFAQVFAEEPWRFPGGDYADDGWLPLLRAAGLRSELDRSSALECARCIEAAAAAAARGGAGARQLVPRALRLLSVLWAQFEVFSAPGFCQQLAAVACVPVRLPVGAASAVSAGAGPSSSGSDYAFVCYGACVLPQDRHLCWTVAPVLPAEVVPPSQVWQALGIRHPPPVPLVLSHVQQLTGGEGTPWDGAALQACPDSAEAVFSSLYGFLGAAWAGLPAEAREQLRRCRMVPVGGGVLVRASRVFFRMPEPLAPFMFEMPRAFGAYDALLTALGATPTPGVQHYGGLLAELAAEAGAACPLNPNELAAVARLLELIVRACRAEQRPMTLGAAAPAAPGAGARAGSRSRGFALADSARAAIGGPLFVPDTHGVLLDSRLCVYRDAPWLATRVAMPEAPGGGGCQLRYVSAAIPRRVCRALGVRPLSAAIRERLSPDADLADAEPPSPGGTSLCAACAGAAAAALVPSGSDTGAAAAAGDLLEGGAAAWSMEWAAVPPRSAAELSATLVSREFALGAAQLIRGSAAVGGGALSAASAGAGWRSGGGSGGGGDQGASVRGDASSIAAGGGGEWDEAEEEADEEAWGVAEEGSGSASAAAFASDVHKALSAAFALSSSSPSPSSSTATMARAAPPAVAAHQVPAAAVAGAAAQRALEAVADMVRARLAGYRVRFVRSLRSRFYYRPLMLPSAASAAQRLAWGGAESRSGGARHSGRAEQGGEEEDVTRAGRSEGSLVFLDAATRCILVGVASLPPSIRAEQLVALAVNQLLASMIQGPALLGLAAALATPPAAVPAVLALLRVCEDREEAAELLRGAPGQPLTAGDRVRVQFRPQRAFFPGETVAWQPPDTVAAGNVGVARGALSAAAAAASAGPLLYGTVVEVENNSLTLVRRLRVRISSSGDETHFLTSDIFCFDPSSGGARGGLDAAGTGASAALASAPRTAGALLAAAAKPDSSRPSVVKPLCAPGPLGGGGPAGEAAGVAEGTSGAVHSLAAVPPRPPVDPSQLMTAVVGILAKVGLSLDDSTAALMAETLALRSERVQLQREVDAAREESAKAQAALEGAKQSMLCQICILREVSVALVPCGHLICGECVQLLCRGHSASHHQCPFDRTKFTSTVPFFNPLGAH